MKRIIRVGSIGRRQVAPDTYATITQICPEGDKGTCFHFSFYENDERFARIKECLEKKGEWKPSDFSIDCEREYESADFEGAFIFELCLTDGLRDVTVRDGDGLLELHSDFWDEPPEIGFAGMSGTAVTSRLKVLIEKVGLQKLVFKPTKVIGGKAKDFQNFYWELTTYVVMPKLSPVCRLVDFNGNNYIDGLSERCIVKDGFTPAEMHYRASDLATMEPFDLARTHEPIGGQAGTFVASRRFYDFCQSENLEIDWIPVRVDPD